MTKLHLLFRTPKRPGHKRHCAAPILASRLRDGRYGNSGSSSAHCPQSLLERWTKFGVAFLVCRRANLWRASSRYRSIRNGSARTGRLHNHIGQTVSTDFFTVRTIAMKVSFVFLVE